MNLRGMRGPLWEDRFHAAYQKTEHPVDRLKPLKITRLAQQLHEQNRTSQLAHVIGDDGLLALAATRVMGFVSTGVALQAGAGLAPRRWGSP